MTRKQKIVDGILTVLIAPGACLVMLGIEDLFNVSGENKLILSIAISAVFWLWVLFSIII